MSASGIVQKQARIAKASKFAGWLTQQNMTLDTFQEGLNKIALYGTAPMIPVVGKILSKTPMVKVMQRGSDLMTALFAKITNNSAYKFQKAIANATGELTPETYVLMRG